MNPMRAFLVLAALAGLTTLPAVAAGPELPDPQCYWNPDFADAVHQATLGIVHLHDGSPVCTVHLHRPTLDAAACAWNPEFADLIYGGSQGTLHPHDGGVCWIHVHEP